MENTPEFYQFLATMGVGGILAGFAIWMLNKAWKEHAEVLKGFHEVEKGRVEMLVGVIERVSTNVVANTIVTQSLHKRLDREAALAQETK